MDMVPKVHPTTRGIEADDPMELVAQPIEGDPDVMLDGLLQEFAWLGMPPAQLLGLFRDPGYPVLNQLVDHFGVVEIQRRIGAMMGDAPLLRFTEFVDETVDEDANEPVLVQIGVCDSLRMKRED